jgi:hypothetical protein
MTTVFAAILGVLPLVTVPAATSGSSASGCRASTAAASLHGDYRWVGGSAERQAWESAIDRVVDQLNIAIRVFARRQIRQKLPIATRRNFQVTSDFIEIGKEGSAIRTPKGKTVRRVNEFGDRVRVTQRFVGPSLIQVFDAPEGTRTNVFVSCNDGEKVIMLSKITSDRLPRAIEFSATYERTRG